MAVRIVYEADYAQLIAAQEELNKLKASGEKVKGGNEKLSRTPLAPLGTNYKASVIDFRY